MRDNKLEYTIKAYSPLNQGKELIYESTHIGIASLEIEIPILESRMGRNEIGEIEVISHIELYGSYHILSLVNIRFILNKIKGLRI